MLESEMFFLPTACIQLLAAFKPCIFFPLNFSFICLELVIIRGPSLSCAFWASASHMMMFETDIHLEAVQHKLDSWCSTGNGNTIIIITTVTISSGGF